MVIRPLLSNAGKKPIYLMVGNKGAGRRQFLFNSSAIKPMDRSRTAKTISSNGMNLMVPFMLSQINASSSRKFQAVMLLSGILLLMR